MVFVCGAIVVGCVLTDSGLHARIFRERSDRDRVVPQTGGEA